MNRRYKEFGKHLVADPKICHGQWTFRGTRVFVKDVLDQVAEGMPWKEISKQWDGNISKEAISEAILLAKSALFDNGRAMKKSA
jgi:uncharacterized protein (DUF433 family)